MAGTPEGRVKAQIKSILDKEGAYRVMPVSNGMGAHGVPDFLVCLNGRFLGIEAKAGKGMPTELQLSNLRRIEEAGGSSLVINEINIGALPGILAVLKMSGGPVSNYRHFEREKVPDGQAEPAIRRRAK
jgi:hypothetical protein